ncbi:retrovirus-related pol polyprotein from transposon TNT 1-94 [Tanacetum coccineum]
MNMLNRNCKTSFVKLEFLKKAQRVNPLLYDIGCYNDNLALMLAPEYDETIRLAQESQSKISDLIRPFDYEKLNNLYDLFVPQREKSPEQRYFSEGSKMSHTSVKNENSKESFNKQTTLLEKRMDESIPINADLENFHLCLKEEMVADLRYFNSLEHEVDSLKSKLETQKTQFLNEIDRLSREYYYVDHMNVILGVYTTLDEFTDLECDCLDQVVKCERLEKELSKSKTTSKSFEALQKHAINLKIALQQYFSKSKSVTTNNVSNDFSKPVAAQILPQNPIVVPISTREPNRNVNQSVATSHKKIVATESTVKKPRSIIRKLYEQVSKTCSWWYPKFTPSGYKWKPKSPIGNVNANVSMPLGNASRTAIILEPMTPKCSKHMTGNLKLLTNFVEKFLGTVKFRNDQIAPILGYADLGNDLLIGSRGTDLYSITLQDTSTPNPICLMAKATSSQAWLWHRKAKQKSFHTKTTSSSKRRLQLLHMDLCGPMRVESINGKNYVLVIIDDYSIYTWTHFLRSKNKTHEVLIDFLTLVQRGLHAQVRTVQTDKGTTFLNKTLHEYFAKEGIRHETSTARTPKQNGITKRRNRTLVEAARTMLSAAKVPLYFWAEAIAITYHVSSDPIPQCQTTELEHDSLSPGPQSQENVPQAAETVTKSNELDLLFSMMFDELINGTTPVVSKSSIYFNNHHPLEQVIGNPSQSIRTRRQLETNGEMCMFALTMCRTEPKNIKEAMVDSAWIKAMQEELHQFDRLDVWELVDIPLCKNVINMKWIWKKKRDEENTIIRNIAHLVAKGYA